MAVLSLRKEVQRENKRKVIPGREPGVKLKFQLQSCVCFSLCWKNSSMVEE